MAGEVAQGYGGKGTACSLAQRRRPSPNLTAKPIRSAALKL
jgi:hypothetical protein